jgi:hypothetical protein
MYADGVENVGFATVDGLPNRCGRNEADWLGHPMASRARR